jgi:hypothetical protein
VFGVMARASHHTVEFFKWGILLCSRAGSVVLLGELPRGVGIPGNGVACGLVCFGGVVSLCCSFSLVVVVVVVVNSIVVLSLLHAQLPLFIKFNMLRTAVSRGARLLRPSVIKVCQLGCRDRCRGSLMLPISVCVHYAAVDPPLRSTLLTHCQ